MYVKHVGHRRTSIKNMKCNSKSLNNEVLQFNLSINNVLQIKLTKNLIYIYFELSCAEKV